MPDLYRSSIRARQIHARHGTSIPCTAYPHGIPCLAHSCLARYTHGLFRGIRACPSLAREKLQPWKNIWETLQGKSINYSILLKTPLVTKCHSIAVLGCTQTPHCATNLGHGHPTRIIAELNIAYFQFLGEITGQTSTPPHPHEIINTTLATLNYSRKIAFRCFDDQTSRHSSVDISSKSTETFPEILKRVLTFFIRRV